MSLDRTRTHRQWDFSGGPNYTASPWHLAQDELAEAANVYWDGGLKVIPGGARLLSATAIGGSSVEVVAVYQYVKTDGTAYDVAATRGGRLVYRNGSSWSNISTTLSTSTSTYWDCVTFNGTLLLASGSNAVKKWDGSSFGNLGGSPPQGKYLAVHGDFVFLAGYTSNPSQLRYSDLATHSTWPSANTLTIGPDDGQHITGLVSLGDVTLVAKEHSLWQVEGASPPFYPRRLPSHVGTQSPDSLVLTDAGVFFWANGAGPAVWDGSRTRLLTAKLRDLLTTVDWANPQKISAAYYPMRRHLLVSYQRSGQSSPDRALLFDFGQAPDGSVCWPIELGFSSAAQFEDTSGRQRLYAGTSNGYLIIWDSGTTWNGNTITPRARTGYLALGGPERVEALRVLDVWTTSASANLIVRYGVDGASNLTTHAQTPISVSTASKAMTHTRLSGDGGTAGKYLVGRALQFEFTTNTATGLTLYGYDAQFEHFGRRNDP